MDAVELVVLVCTDCQGVYAVQAEWMRDNLEEDEVPCCYYCDFCNVNSIVGGVLM